jgi:hypothetical protein
VELWLKVILMPWPMSLFAVVQLATVFSWSGNLRLSCCATKVRLAAPGSKRQYPFTIALDPERAFGVNALEYLGWSFAL